MKWAWSECCRVCTSLTLTDVCHNQVSHSLIVFNY